MTQWLLIRRLRGPAFLLLVGILAMLQEWTSFGFHKSWPLFVILAGVFALAERAALSQATFDNYDPITGQMRTSAGVPFGSNATPSGAGPAPTDPARNPTAAPGDQGSF